MINVLQKHESPYIGTCNACCDNKGEIEIKFKSAYGGGGVVVTLCKDCIKELRQRLPPEEDDA